MTMLWVGGVGTALYSLFNEQEAIMAHPHKQSHRVTETQAEREAKARKESQERQKAVDERAAAANEAKAEKAEPAERPRVVISDDLAAVLSDKYPHHDIRYVKNGIEVVTGGGVVSVDAAEVGKRSDKAQLRAYIDSLPVL